MAMIHSREYVAATISPQSGRKLEIVGPELLGDKPMSMNMIRFAAFISNYSNRANISMDLWEVEDFKKQIEDIFDEPTPTASRGTHDVAKATEEMIQAMAKGQKINAIKAYRILTDAGLKEAKDAIESVMGVYTPIAS